MKQFTVIFLVSACVIMSSCVPYKNTVYLQNQAAATDSTMQIIEKQKPYHIQINDIYSTFTITLAIPFKSSKIKASKLILKMTKKLSKCCW